jgi:hypothetical protein
VRTKLKILHAFQFQQPTIRNKRFGPLDQLRMLATSASM